MNNSLHIPSFVFFFSFYLGFPGSSDGKEYACSVGDPDIKHTHIHNFFSDTFKLKT